MGSLGSDDSNVIFTRFFIILLVALKIARYISPWNTCILITFHLLLFKKEIVMVVKCSMICFECLFTLTIKYLAAVCSDIMNNLLRYYNFTDSIKKLVPSFWYPWTMVNANIFT